MILADPDSEENNLPTHPAEDRWFGRCEPGKKTERTNGLIMARERCRRTRPRDQSEDASCVFLAAEPGTVTGPFGLHLVK